MVSARTDGGWVQKSHFKMQMDEDFKEEVEAIWPDVSGRKQFLFFKFFERIELESAHVPLAEAYRRICYCLGKSFFVITSSMSFLNDIY